MQTSITVILLGRSFVRRGVLICAMLVIEQWQQKSFPNLNLTLAWSRSTHSGRPSPVMVTSTRFSSNLSANTLSAFLYLLAMYYGDKATPPQGCTSLSPASYVHRTSSQTSCRSLTSLWWRARSLVRCRRFRTRQEIRRWLPSTPRCCGSSVMKISNGCKSRNRLWRGCSCNSS